MPIILKRNKYVIKYQIKKVGNIFGKCMSFAKNQYICTRFYQKREKSSALKEKHKKEKINLKYFQKNLIV
jgi:hypothetical protein